MSTLLSRLPRLLFWPADLKFPTLRDIRRYMVFMQPYIRKHWPHYAGQFVVMLFGVAYTVMYAAMLKRVTEAAVHHTMARVEASLVMLLGLFLIDTASQALGSYLYTSSNVLIRKDLTASLFQKMLHLPLMSMSKYHTGDLTSRLQNDVEVAVAAVGTNLINLVRLPLTAATAFVYLWTLRPGLALTAVVFGPIALICAVVFRPALRRNGRALQGQYGHLYMFLGEALSGLSVIRSFVLEHWFAKAYQGKNETWVHYEQRGARLHGYFRVTTQMTGYLAFSASFGLGALYVAQGKLSVGSLLACVSLLQYVLSPFTGVTQQLGGLQRALAASERIWQVFEEPSDEPVSHDETEPVNLPVDALTTLHPVSIRMQGVSFSYDGIHNVLSEVSVNIPKGKVVAFVGPSGAGKTTLFNLALGFYRPQTGGVWLNGVATEQLGTAALRRQMAYVPQETYLFSGTIRENLLHGRPWASMEEVVQAAVDANIHEFIESLPEGYETPIAERGMRLSGGQRQRIAIARAILKDAPILLLDEATSSLDTETEHLVQEALQRLMRNRTTMVIAHRLSTVQNADLIVVMQNGRVLETGSHSELLRRGGFYARLCDLQLHHAVSLVGGE